MTLYRIDIEAADENELENKVADGRWKPEIINPLVGEIDVEAGAATFSLNLDQNGAGGVSSDQHYTEQTWVGEFGDEYDNFIEAVLAHRHHEGCIDALESFLLALAMAGVDVRDSRIVGALNTTLDAIGNNT